MENSLGNRAETIDYKPNKQAALARSAMKKCTRMYGEFYNDTAEEHHIYLGNYIKRTTI
jgi:hypothetical protein